MSFSNYLEGKILDHMVGKTSFTMPTAYVSLHTADPGETGTSETSGTSYARKSTAGSDWNAAGADGQIENAGTITFATAGSGGWGTVTHFGLWDAATTGNFLGSGALGASKTIDSGDTASFAASALVITLD